MKLTKGMKKALSLLLSAAMVVTGVNVTTNTASAESKTSYKVSVVAQNGKTAGVVTGDAKPDTKKPERLGWDQDWGKDAPEGTAFEFTKEAMDAMKGYSKPTVKVTVSDGKKVLLRETTYWKYGNGADYADGAVIDLSETIKKADKEWDTLGFGFWVPGGATAEFDVYDAAAPANTETTAPASTAAVSTSNAAISTTPAVAATTPAVATEAPTEEPAPTAKPEPANAKDGHQAFLMFTDSNWKWGCWNANVGEDAVVTGNGTYTVSINKSDFKASDVAEPAKGATVFCVDILGMCNSQKFDASKAAISDVVIKCDGKEFKADASKMYEGDIEGKGNYRLEIRNEYGWGNGEFLTKDEFDPDGEFGFEESLSVTFTVKGIKEGTTPEDAFKTTVDGEETSVVSAVGERAKVADVEDTKTTETPATTVPSTKSAVATTKPAVTTTKPAVTTKPAITTAAAVKKGTSKLTAAKKFVVVAPGKTVKVPFKATKAKNTSGAAVVKATSKSKKVATVKVKGKNVVIKAPKKAVKGASTTVTLKSKKANGEAISAKIKVYVRNSAKKVKAAKKSITVKKGKTTKLVIKASKLQNKKKAFADTITVKGKVLKLTNVKFAKGKATLTLKGAKKAKKKAVTIKVGKKAVKVKATVK